MVDVRSNDSIGKFMKLIRKGKLTIILVYADWCGHCHHFMPHFDAAAKNPNRSIQAAKVNETMLPQVNEALARNNHAVEPINVEGYPSVILVNNKGEKVTDVEPVKNTDTMTKVMNESGKLAEEVQLGAEEPAANTMTTSIGTTNMRQSPPNTTSLNSVTTPNFIMNAKDDMGEKEGISLGVNQKTSNKKPLNQKMSNTMNIPVIKATNIPQSAKELEAQTEALASMRTESPSLAIPPTASADQENVETIREPASVYRPGLKGGSLYAAMSQSAYTLAAPAALLATAALVMKRRNTHRRSKKHGTRKRRHMRR
jgi:thiol-disulfide isomerase/thioredoxin